LLLDFTLESVASSLTSLTSELLLDGAASGCRGHARGGVLHGSVGHHSVPELILRLGETRSCTPVHAMYPNEDNHINDSEAGE